MEVPAKEFLQSFKSLFVVINPNRMVYTKEIIPLVLMATGVYLPGHFAAHYISTTSTSTAGNDG